MIAGSYRFTDEHLTEIIEINEPRPQDQGSLPVRRRNGTALVSSDAGLRARPPRRTKLAQGDGR
ncbi:MAG: hypothetical protein JWO67_985 [Streptosporangiaceae bacterium]|nr:hypothetical protein [Streptosporangiaceae bacterium]